MHEALLKIVRRQIMVFPLLRLISRRLHVSPYCNLGNCYVYFQEERLMLYPPSTYYTGKELPLPDIKEQRISPEQVLEVLQTCYDPCCKERAVSIVELGLIH